MASLSIVIPAYNEEGRLPQTLQKLEADILAGLYKYDVKEVIVVNDGSTDRTAQVLAENPWVLLKTFHLSRNQGKGAAVHRGLAQAKSSWVLVADADMATPWEEMNKFVAVADNYDLVMGSRALPESRVEVRQHFIRQSMGKTFNRLLRALVGLPYKDTQCGFKLLRNDRDLQERILPRLQVQRFAWDVELILALQRFNKRIVEFPVIWRHQEASHVRIVRDSLEMLFSVLKIRFRLFHK